MEDRLRVLTIACSECGHVYDWDQAEHPTNPHPCVQQDAAHPPK